MKGNVIMDRIQVVESEIWRCRNVSELCYKELKVRPTMRGNIRERVQRNVESEMGEVGRLEVE